MRNSMRRNRHVERNCKEHPKARVLIMQNQIRPDVLRDPESDSELWIWDGLSIVVGKRRQPTHGSDVLCKQLKRMIVEGHWPDLSFENVRVNVRLWWRLHDTEKGVYRKVPLTRAELLALLRGH